MERNDIKHRAQRGCIVEWSRNQKNCFDKILRVEGDAIFLNRPSGKLPYTVIYLSEIQVHNILPPCKERSKYSHHEKRKLV